MPIKKRNIYSAALLLALLLQGDRSIPTEEQIKRNKKKV